MKEIKEFEHDNLYTMQLAAGEEIVIEPGSMVCMSAGVECRTKTSGGFKRKSVCSIQYCAARRVD